MKKPLLKKGIAVAVIVLFVGMSIPSTGTVVEKSIISFDGKTLYVGGDGPGNYSKIQDAIDNASDGDTVSVFVSNSYGSQKKTVDGLVLLFLVIIFG
ncbi:MAG: hypothetical protein JSW60_09460 [Thermoplasmatales archaeon]|nr:MAG: hypothetical protein JSW60_09460 [Thermoplasmatales archaeon]